MKDYLLNELHRHHAKLNKPLQAMVAVLIGLCKEATNIKSRLKIPSNTGNLGIIQKLDAIITQAEQMLPQETHVLHQAQQAERAYSVLHNLIDKSSIPNPVISLLLISICVFIDAVVNSLRIPLKAATDSTRRLPPKPVKAATLSERSDAGFLFLLG